MSYAYFKLQLLRRQTCTLTENVIYTISGNICKHIVNITLVDYSVQSGKIMEKYGSKFILNLRLRVSYALTTYLTVNIQQPLDGRSPALFIYAVVVLKGHTYSLF